MTGESDGTQVLSSVRNALRVLTSFSAEEREFGVSELARRLGVGKSTVHRLLATLAKEHFVEQDPISEKYRLGLRVYELGALVSIHIDLHEAAAPYLLELRNRTGETVQVAVLDGREVVYVERLESTQTIRVFGRVGHRNSAHCTSTGKVLLAHLPRPELDALLDGWVLEAKTPYTITDPKRFLDELATVRQRGYAENDNEAEVGLFSVAAPIRDRSGTVLAACSVVGPTIRLERDSLRSLAKLTMEAAEAISRRLGYWKQTPRPAAARRRTP